MKFRKYQHIERLGTSEVQEIMLGKCYIFPKIDGTNASTWLDDNEIKCGSRNRELSLEADNAGFAKYISEQAKFTAFHKEYPTLRLYGEWLVPHSLKTYRGDAWRDFYVFDVVIETEGVLPRYLEYEKYKELLDEFNINYIVPIAITNNPQMENIQNAIEKNTYLIQEDSGVGEGIVVKRYDFVNQYGRQTWAKVVTNEFKDKHRKEMGPSEISGKKITEEDMVEVYLTEAMVDKVKAKISLQHDGFRSENIGQLLGMVWHDFVTEELWEIIKKYKNPTIDFKTLQFFVYRKTKIYGGVVS